MHLFPSKSAILEPIFFIQLNFQFVICARNAYFLYSQFHMKSSLKIFFQLASFSAISHFHDEYSTSKITTSFL